MSSPNDIAITGRGAGERKREISLTAPEARPVAGRARRLVVAAAVPVPPSKITAPGTPDWAVPRPRVGQLITQATRWCPLTVVTGPPGAGKTMALALWAAAESRTVAWVALDSHDDRPAVFWSYVVAALQRSGVAVPGGPPADAPGQPAHYRLLLNIVSALAGRDRPVILILDDFHVLSHPQVLSDVDFVLRNAGAGLRLVACARMDPLLSLYRYRLAGHLAEIRASDLAFSTAEAGLLLAQHGVTLRAGSLERLMQRTEGWAAGLRLAAISMGPHPEPDQFVHELATEGSALTSYLLDEILNAQPPEVRDVLLSTSIFEEFEAEAAREVAGNEHTREILAALARANTFIQPAGRGRFRYHNLFADVLRLKLERERPGGRAALHRRAARWYERNGLLTEAVRHAVQAGDWALAASIVVEALAISEIIEPWGSRSLGDEFRLMPAGEAWAEPPPYLVAAAMALSAGQLERCAAALSAAEDLLGRLPAEQQAAGLLAATMIHHAVSCRAGDLTVAATAAGRAELLVGKIPGRQLALYPEIRVRVLAGRGTAELWAGHLGEAARILESAAETAASAGSGRGRAHCLGRLALVAALRGQLTVATSLASSALATGNQQPPAGNPDPAALAALATAHLERMELREARDLLRRAEAGLAMTPDRPVQVVFGLIMACSALAERHAGSALEIIATARRGTACSRLARTAAGPGRIAGARGHGRHPGRTRRCPARWRQQLAGVGGRPRVRVGGRRRRRQRQAGARTRTGRTRRGARPGVPASSSGRRLAVLSRRRSRTRPPVTRVSAAAR